MSYQVHLLRPLASGGNADVQLGQRSDTRAYVVVKYLREWHLDHARKGFAREVRILDQKLPGMIPILFSDVKTERPYYVMPYHAGGSLTKHAGRLSDQQLLAVANASARSLAALHARHIDHGDFKPDNILITDEGNLQLADPLGNGSVAPFFSRRITAERLATGCRKYALVGRSQGPVTLTPMGPRSFIF